MPMKNHMANYRMILLCLACLFPAAALADDDEARFGRLFTESKTRQQLDVSRKQNSLQQLPVIEEEVEEDPAVTALKLDGMIMRRDGSTEVWVNGVSTQDSQRQGIMNSGGNNLRVAVPGGEVILKPGQVYSFESRRVLEGFEHRDAPAPRRPPS